jgi:hypothetical protein
MFVAGTLGLLVRQMPARLVFTVRPTQRSAAVVGAGDAVEMTPTNCGLRDYSGDTRLAIG